VVQGLGGVARNVLAAAPTVFESVEALDEDDGILGEYVDYRSSIVRDEVELPIYLSADCVSTDQRLLPGVDVVDRFVRVEVN
jgi:hypothetical protein